MPLVQNFGHYWARDKLELGQRGYGNAGTLLGYQEAPYTEGTGQRVTRSSPNWRPQNVDFSKQVGVYALLTPEFELVYIGQAGSQHGILNRVKNHTRNRNRERWTHFSWFGLRPVDDLIITEEANTFEKADILNSLEGIVIHLTEPRLNRQGARWGGVDEYVQYDPKEWETE